ncbi:putative Zinc finger, BED-type [Corchorus olitorius]|uniref:Zinc finger, BED-type n=1 Tax=Corchorus olitorius TaxID=93759 RepID=A0A1R3JHH9_9ROSI|nr:putative Zinc finger, BED-type [Corchorus olitorius]
MAETASTLTRSAPLKSDDPAWAHGIKVAGKRNQSICLYCNKHIQGGGMTRLNQHLAGVSGNVGSCPKAPSDVQWEMKRLLE